MLITFEGIDRSGKTTQARLLKEALGDDALLVREPGGTPSAERIRDVVKDPSIELSAIGETLLFGAARAELVATVIRPALAERRIVICDRYVDSTVAYQGGARGLGIDRVEELNRWITDGLEPDVTFLLEIDPGRAAARSGESDRLEAEGAELQRAVAAAYEVLAERHASRYVRIDASRPVEDTHREIVNVVRQRLPLRNS